MECEGHDEFPLIGVEFAPDQCKQAGLADAVGTGETDFLAFVEDKRGVGKKYPGASAQGDVFKIEHYGMRLKWQWGRGWLIAGKI